MSDATVNVEDTVGRTAGRRGPRDAAKAAMVLQKLVNQLRKSQGYGAICRKGVFRFRSFEEADAWMVKEIAERAARVRS
ncbi:MAG: hypothetical protein ACREIF_02755 [Chthoniobacterales bacterium]